MIARIGGGRTVGVAARPALMLAAVILAIGSVTGCGNPNGGQRAAADFDAWFAEHPYEGMSVDDVSLDEALPFIGTATITLVLAGDVTADDLARAMSHVCPFEPGGASTASFEVVADTVSAPVDCADPRSWVRAWEAVREVDELQEAELETGYSSFRFSSGRRLVEGLSALRDIDWSVLGVRHLEIAVGAAGGEGEWSLREDTDATEGAKRVVLEVLGTGIPVARMSVTAGNPNRDEEVTVVLVSSDAGDRRRMEQLVLGADPARRALVRVETSPPTQQPLPDTEPSPSASGPAS